MPTHATPVHDTLAQGVAPFGFDLVYADASLLVAGKPAGLLAVPGRGDDKQDCLSRRVQALYPEALVVHRLDMATSGLMLLARSRAVQRSLSQAFADRQIQKTYEAVVQGLPGMTAPDEDGWATINLPIAVDWPRRPLRVIEPLLGKPSLTRWRILSQDAPGNATRLVLQPVTGRSHQLRVHLQALGHPILGDALYATAQGQASAPRLLLHARELRLIHPVTGVAVHFKSPTPF
ncbi:RluA family pseudouridine synthase [Polaromonas sp.]|uniref:RluA family pseudouridine synthase n=1 Tax=Polaromonas sp. TaxID=1869339 RepID=UPI002BA1C5B3|nr:RluA family pseudouridine synthase [Polaromonas sp.]HQS90170.1 RluA family pseudouridine synthase [Polaromonas sp.]